MQKQPNPRTKPASRLITVTLRMDSKHDVRASGLDLAFVLGSDSPQAIPTLELLAASQQPPREPKQFAGVLLTGKTEPCQGHPQPLDMIDEPDKSRPGFIRSKCRHCGKFLGYRRDN